jgi:aminoglycoside/choline kinase family phosphotransferase
MCGITLTEAKSKELDRIFLSVCTTLHREPKFIAHRDYHSRNVMLKLGRARIIDFQDARMGSVQYDLVSLLRDSYVRIPEDMAASLIDYYIECRSMLQTPDGKALPKTSRDQFQEIFEVQTVQRCFKACGSFASFYNLRKDTRYLKYLAPTLQTVKKAISLFDEYKAFHDILVDRGVFDQKFEVA